jgi:hypothetical protein
MTYADATPTHNYTFVTPTYLHEMPVTALWRRSYHVPDESGSGQGGMDNVDQKYRGANDYWRRLPEE